MYVCFDFEDKVELPTPIIVLASYYGSHEERLASQIHFADDRKKCVSTLGLWMKESKVTRLEFSWAAQDDKGDSVGSFTVSLEVNLS